MMAYMNQTAYEQTLQSKRATFYSRSRQALWIKGETSGNTLHVVSMAWDCDEDTLLCLVNPDGPACHTGSESCFEANDTTILTSVWSHLFDTIQDRKLHPKENAYTTYLFNKGLDKILKKVGEESAEVIIAAKNPNHDDLVGEIADLAYHVAVLMVEKGVALKDVEDKLASRIR